MTNKKSEKREKRKKVFRADRLRILEEEFPGNQDDFAAAVDMEQSQVSRYLTGRSEPSPDVIRRFSEKLNVSSDWLLGLTERRHNIDPDNLSRYEIAAIERIREKDVQGLMRVGLKISSPEDDDEPHKSKPKKK